MGTSKNDKTPGLREIQKRAGCPTCRYFINSKSGYRGSCMYALGEVTFDRQGKCRVWEKKR